MADPITQAQIQTEYATTLAEVENSGIVIIDSKWSSDDRELYDLLTQQGSGRAKGSVLEWVELPGYEVAGDRLINIIFRWRWRIFYPYQNDSTDGKTSLELFRNLVDASIQALNANRMPDTFANNVEIISILTRQPFAVLTWINSAKPESSHLGDFNIDFKVQQPC